MASTSFFKKAEDYHNTDAPVVAFRIGETGYYPIYTRLTAEQLNPIGITDEILDSAEAGSMFGWEAPAAELALEFAKFNDLIFGAGGDHV